MRAKATRPDLSLRRISELRRESRRIAGGVVLMEIATDYSVNSLAVKESTQTLRFGQSSTANILGCRGDITRLDQESLKDVAAAF
jgi:hypothetical protein